jgi:hypothetical protein
MAYVCELGAGRHVYLDNPGTQTVVTSVSGGPGQQQQSSSSFLTGVWTAPPALFNTPQGTIIKLVTDQGQYQIQLQGNSIGLMGNQVGLGQAQQMQVQQTAAMPAPAMEPMRPMESMKPMPPMRMGNMSMNTNPMEMRMGDMEMRMPGAAASPEPATGARRFCSQCGSAIAPDDRFCAHCGHRLV